MPTLPFRLYDSFAGHPGAGNPAAVFLLDDWLPDEELAAIAQELNAWTAFACRAGDIMGEHWRVRVFTIPPIVETALCGHALLATARALFDGPAAGQEHVVLETRDGTVMAVPHGHGGSEWRGLGAEIDFPAIAVEPAEAPAGIAAALGGRPLGWWRRIEGYPAWIALYETAAELAALPRDPLALRAVAALVLATATDESGDAEIASRLFQPMKSLIEDPAGGTQHALAAPFWAGRLGRHEVFCRSASPRGGHARCRLLEGRVAIAAPVTLSAEGTLHR